MEPTGMELTGMGPTGMEPAGMEPTGMEPAGVGLTIHWYQIGVASATRALPFDACCQAGVIDNDVAVVQHCASHDFPTTLRPELGAPWG